MPLNIPTKQTGDTLSASEFNDVVEFSNELEENKQDASTALDNVSGTNTGDETTASIQTKRPLKTINGETLEGSGNIVISGGAGAVDSVNGEIGNVVLDADDISDTSTTNKFVTAAEKSTISTAVQPGDLSTVATSGSYDDLDDKPTIPSATTDASDLTTGTLPDARLSSEVTDSLDLADNSIQSITAGANITTSGDGSTSNPLIINSTYETTTLNNTLTSTATDEAATANVAKVLNDKIEAAIIGAGTSTSPITKNDWNGTIDTWDVGSTIPDGHQLFATNVFLIEGTDYTVSGSVITYTDPPLAAEVHTYYPNVVVGGGGGSATTDAADLTSGVLADARVQESNVTQHQAALSINASQIPDLPPSGSVDKTTNLFLDNGTAFSPELGVSNTFNGNDYEMYIQQRNNGSRLYWGITTDNKGLSFSSSSIAPTVTEEMSLGNTTLRFLSGYFSSSVFASGIKTPSNEPDILLGNGTTIENTFLEKPSASQYTGNRTAELKHGNGTVNFYGSFDSEYTLNTGIFDIGTRILLSNENALSLNVIAGAGITINNNSEIATGKAAWLVQVDLDEWILIKMN